MKKNIKLLEDNNQEEIIRKACEDFASQGIDVLDNYDNNFNRTLFNNGENQENNVSQVNNQNNYNTIPEEKLKNRLIFFNKSHMTNDTIRFIVNLYNKIKNNSSDNERDNAIINVYKTIKYGAKRLEFEKPNDENEKFNIKNQIASSVRKSIMGIKSGNYTERLREPTDDSFNKFYEKHHDELMGNDDLLKYLTDEEWEEFCSTLDEVNVESNNPNKKERERENDERGMEKIKEFVKIVSKATFDSKIPGIIINFYDTVKEECSDKIYPGTCRYYDFGKRRFKIFDSNIKQIYVDITKNNGSINNIKYSDLYRSIPEQEFWKNVAVVSCYSSRTYSIITSMIFQLNKRDELNIRSTGNLTTGLNTRSTLFILNKNDIEQYKQNDDGRKISRKSSNEKENSIFDKNLYAIENRLISGVNRYYFILVTEGYFKVGGIMKNAINNAKNLIKNIKNYDRI